MTTRADSSPRWLRWLIAIATLLTCLAVPACSQKAVPARAPAARRPQAAPAGGSAPKGQSRPPGEAGAQKAAAPKPVGRQSVGPPRRHPFAPANDPAMRRALSLAGLGTLALKGIVGGPAPTAIIEEGGRVHYLAEGESLGTLTVLEIREDEVVLGAGRQKRILSLYEPQRPTR